MSQIQMVLHLRCLPIIKELSVKIDAALPTIKDFCKYRSDILKEEQTLDSIALLQNEESLQKEIDRLEKRIIDVKDDEKKKDFVNTQVKLNATKNDLANVSKQLNHRLLLETKAVTDNEAKFKSSFSWIQKQLDIDCIDDLILQDGQDTKNCIVNPTRQQTTIEKSRTMMKFFNTLQSDVTSLKNKIDILLREEIELDRRREVIKVVQGELDTCRKQHINNGKFNDYVITMNQNKADKLRQMKQVEILLKEDLEKTKQDVQEERRKHMDVISHYSFCIDHQTDAIHKSQLKWKHRQHDLKKVLERLCQKRESNLKVLLELKLTWQEYNNRKVVEEEEKLRNKAVFVEKEKQHHAATILQNKIRVTCLSQLKKSTKKKIPTRKKKKSKQ